VPLKTRRTIITMAIEAVVIIAAVVIVLVSTAH
jgi:hypothetical protein